MRKTVATFFIALSACCAFAQSDVLLEACNAMPDADKRLECLKAARGQSSQSQAGAKDDAIRNSFLGLHAKLEVGISLINYNTALLEVGRDLAVYSQDAAPEKAKGIQRLRDAMQVYKDAGTLWSTSVEFYSQRGNSTSFAWGLPYDSVGLGWLVERYNLPVGKADLLGFNRGIPVEASRAQMWMQAKQIVDEGVQLLKQADKS